MPQYRAAALQHHVAAGALRQAAADLVVDHLVLVGLRAFELGRGEFNHLDRHIRTEAQTGVGDIVCVPLLTLATAVGDLFGGLRPGRWRGIAQQGAQVELIRMLDDALLGLASEQLTLEPVELLLEGGDFSLGRFQRRLKGMDDSFRIRDVG